jgi:signal transduction histidine kinase/ActR/RegA family two-component response regulator
MNVPATLSVIAVVIGIGISVFAWKISSAPNWRHKRVFACAVLCASVYEACDIFATIDPGPSLFVTLMRVQAAAAMLHGGFWLVYAFAALDVRRPRTRRVVMVVTTLVAALALVPGCMFTSEVQHVDVAWLGISYLVPTMTVFGMLASAADCLVLLVPVVLYVRARRRVPGAMLRAVGLMVLVACAVQDTFAAALSLHIPLVTTVGFLVLIGTVGLSLTNAFVASARELDALTKRLEQRVAERTSALVAAETALARAEKLAAIGKLSSGVAHAINNPSAAIAANLDYLRMGLAQGSMPLDAKECLDESLDAIQQVAKVVRQLLDSTGSAAPSQVGRTSVRDAIEQAVASARAHVGERVTIDIDAPPTLFARADHGALVEVLVNLVINGAQAIPDDQTFAHVSVRAHERDGQVSIDVSDNGTGIADDVRPRLFEPFFTTKSFGQGTGLGLAVSLGLVRSMGGELAVDSSPGCTTMTVKLAPAVEQRAEAPDSSARVVRPRLLFVDDDLAVRTALCRSLRSRFDVTGASGVEQAMERIAAGRFDLVLSDWQMPDGGGRHLLELLRAKHPDVARRLVFVTGAELTREEREWLDAAEVTVLSKPLSTEALLAEISRIARGGATVRGATVREEMA